MSLTEDQQRLKQMYIDTGDDLSDGFEEILQLDPLYFEAYLKLRQVPLNTRKLSRKVQELLMLAMDASCTHLYIPGVKAHTVAALKAGASKEEVLETLELSSVLGVHSLSVGVPTLCEVLAENGSDYPTGDNLNEQQQKLKDDFVKQRGYWSGSWPPILQLSPEFFGAYTQYSSVPFQPGHSALEPKVKELVYCAIDCATTHLFQPGLKIHIQNAIRLGASPEEIMEVFALAALMGATTMQVGCKALADHMKNLK